MEAEGRGEGRGGEGRGGEGRGAERRGGEGRGGEGRRGGEGGVGEHLQRGKAKNNSNGRGEVVQTFAGRGVWQTLLRKAKNNNKDSFCTERTASAAREKG